MNGNVRYDSKLINSKAFHLEDYIIPKAKANKSKKWKWLERIKMNISIIIFHLTQNLAVYFYKF